MTLITFAPVPRAAVSATAYDLLTQIIDLIVEEPRRLRMADWLRGVDRLHPEYAPACGTIGCIAGWITVLTRPFSLERLDLDPATAVAKCSYPNEDDDAFLREYYSIAELAVSRIFGPKEPAPEPPDHYCPSREDYDCETDRLVEAKLTDTEKAMADAWDAHDTAVEAYRERNRDRDGFAELFDPTPVKGRAGELAHAESAAAIIRQYRDTHEDFLRSRTIQPWSVPDVVLDYLIRCQRPTAEWMSLEGDDHAK